MELEELRRRHEEIRGRAERHLNEMEQIAVESQRVADVARDTRKILEDLDKQFEDCTGLTAKDISFLFVAVALQIIRQYIFTKFPERLDDQTAAENTRGHKEEHSGRMHRYYEPSLDEIVSNPVPFDANIGANGALAGGKQMGHRVTALGHDPLLGLVVGTANIATATLTNNRFQSYHIYTNDRGRDYFSHNANTAMVFSKTADKLLYRGLEGKKIIGASLVKELVHLNSDINSKNSLPLPIIPVINAGLAADLAKMGFDMCNVVTVGKQAGYSILINTLVYMLHGALYDESIDNNRRLYEVRTRKILSYSNIIASSSNLIYTGVNMALGNESALRSLDFGGLIVTVYRVATDARMIRKIKQEFIEQEFFDQIRGSEYNFSD